MRCDSLLLAYLIVSDWISDAVGNSCWWPISVSNFLEGFFTLSLVPIVVGHTYVYIYILHCCSFLFLSWNIPNPPVPPPPWKTLNTCNFVGVPQFQTHQKIRLLLSYCSCWNPFFTDFLPDWEVDIGGEFDQQWIHRIRFLWQQDVENGLSNRTKGTCLNSSNLHVSTCGSGLWW